MSNLKVEINFNDLVGDMFVNAEIENEDFGSQCSPSMSFSESLKSEIIGSIANKIIVMIKKECMAEAEILAKENASNFITNELHGILLSKLRSGDIHTKYDGIKNFDELIEKKISSINIDQIISKHIERKSNEFAIEMKARYDNIFAAKIVHSLKEQKMLAPDIAKILLGE